MSPRRVYAVSWRETDSSQYVGKLELLVALLRLEGRGQGRSEIGRAIAYSQVASVTSVRETGHRALVIALRDAGHVAITSLDGPGALTELEQELRRRTEKPYRASGVAPMPAGP